MFRTPPILFGLGLLLVLILSLSFSARAGAGHQATRFLEFVAAYDLPEVALKADIAFDLKKGRVFLSDPFDEQLFVFSEETRKFNKLPLQFARRLFNPQSLCVDDSGHLWLVNPYAHEVLRIDGRGNLVQSLTSPDISLDKPVAIACVGQQVWFVDLELQSLFEVDTGEDGRIIRRPLALSRRLTSVKLAAKINKSLYLLDPDQQLLYQLSPDSNTPRLILKGDPDQKGTIRGLCSGPGQNLLICSSGRPSIRELTPSGEEAHRFVLAEPHLEFPVALAFSGNELWVADSGRDCVLRFRLRRAESGIEHSILGQEYLVFDQVGLALREFEKALDQGFSSFEMRMAWGRAFYRQKKFESALSQFHEALQVYAENADALLGQARCYRDLGQSGTATEYYTKVLNVDSGNYHAAYELGLIHLEQQQIQKAQVFLEQSLEQKPDFKAGSLALGRVHLEKKDYDQAQAIFESLFNSTSRHVSSRARFYLGLIALEQHDFKQAQEHLSQSVRQGPYFSDAFFALGQAYAGLGETEKARQSYQQALEIDPEHQQAKHALKHMR